MMDSITTIKEGIDVEPNSLPIVKVKQWTKQKCCCKELKHLK